MALSQLQCLDENHVNPRTHESKPEFLYCEDQRLALEALLQNGRQAFFKFLDARGLRGFLSDPELDALAGAVEPYDPGAELFPEDAEDDEPPLSLHYWPELSDTSIPQMDLGWPHSDGYRGVTRTTVYAQPSLDDQAHVKEIVRKMIAQAQKVIAVVMDVFTDVDIFRDLLDAGFKRRVSVYILLERATLPHFLSMCRRANMHAGHLKHLRVRCTGGLEFHTRSSTKVGGRMGHRFMFVDGDKAVSGSYSFTWMSSRLDRNLISVTTGQAVDAFDKVFRTLYANSSSVDLRQVATEPEPEPEPLPQPVTVAPPSAAVARKLYNPKYALVLGSPSPSPSPTHSTGYNSPRKTQSPENSRCPDVSDTKKRRRRRASKEPIQEAPIHPGLIDLEKACLMSYLPTWPEPDPPSDVIGFINIRDASKPTQVHLQRSEMFGTSQAIKFSSPISIPKEILPEVAKPRQLTAKYEEMNKLQPAQDETKAEESVGDRAQPTQLSAQTSDIKSKAEAPEEDSPASGSKCDKDTDKSLNTKNTLHSNTPTNQEAGHNPTPHLNAHAAPQSSTKASKSNTGGPSHTTQAVTTSNPMSDSHPGSNTEDEEEEQESIINTQSATVYRTHALDLISTHTSHGATDSDTRQNTQTKMVLPHADSRTQPQNSSEMTPNIQTPTVNSHVSPSPTSAMCSQSVSSTSLSENNHASITTSKSSTALDPPPPSSSAPSSLTSTPPVPKPRTIQLLINVIRKPENSTRTQVLHGEPETIPELHDDRGSKTGMQKDEENTGNIREASRQKQSGTFQETKKKEAFGRHDFREGMLTVTNLKAQSDDLISDALKAKIVNSPKDVEPKTLTAIDCKLTPQIDSIAKVQAGTRAPERGQTGCEFAEVPNKNSKKTYYTSAHEQRISYCALTPQGVGVLDTVGSLKAPTHTPVSTTHDPHTSKDIAGESTHTSVADRQGQQGNPSFTPAQGTSNTAKHSPQNTFQELIPKERGRMQTPEKSPRLHLSDMHAPDLRSPTPERESRLLTALIRTTSPDGFLPRSPTPDSRTHTPDPRSHTPDFQTPMSDISDGYISPTVDSAVSTTSEEYYECSDSPVFDRAGYRNHGTTEGHVNFTQTNALTSPAYINSKTHPATLDARDRTSSGSETQSLSGPDSVSSSTSSIVKKVKMQEEEETVNEENGSEVDEKGRKLSVAERRTEGDSRGTQKRGSEEVKRTADHFKQAKDLTEAVEKNKEAHAPKRKRVLSQSAAERTVDGGVTQRESTNEGAESKRLSAGDLRPKKAPSEEERPHRAALGPSGVERRGRPQSARETEGLKPLHTPPRRPRGQQQDSGASSPSQPSRAPRPSSSPRPLRANQPLGPRPYGSKQANQTDSKVSDNTSSPRRTPPRTPPPASAGAVAAGQKQAEASHGQQSAPSQQPQAAQGRARAGQSPNRHPHPKPPASFLHTHANALPQLHPHSQNMTGSAQEAQSQEEGKTPFSITFSRLYSLKGLKDKMSKLPAQSRRSSTSSPARGHKSTS